MAWSDHMFSDQFSAARGKLKNGAVADTFAAQKTALLQAMSDSGFEASANPALEALRSAMRNPTTGEAPGTQQDSRLLRAVGHSGAATGDVNQDTRERAGALKFMSHVYLIKQRGAQKVWIHNLPTAFADWPHYATGAASADAVRPMLRASTGASTPTVIVNSAEIQIRQGLQWRRARAARIVDIVATAPNTGQAQPKTLGSSTNSRAMAGKNVAGMM